MLGEGEEFDQGCLCVGDVDNSGSGHGQYRDDAPIQQITITVDTKIKLKNITISG